jgi:sirohydrochlorin ferrochelatase
MSRHVRALGCALAALLSLPCLVAAQTGPVGTIVLAHGGGATWNSRVADAARSAETGGPMEVAFLEGFGTPDLRLFDAAQRLLDKGVSRIVVVPMFVSSHSNHYDEIRFLTGSMDAIDQATMEHMMNEGNLPIADLGVPVHLAPAIDDSPEAARVLADRARALASDPAREALFLVGHGPNLAEEDAEWMKNLRRIAETVHAQVPFVSVRVGLVRDDAPEEVRRQAVNGIRETIELQHQATGRPVIVVPILISMGDLNRVQLPVDLEGLPITYEGIPLLPHPEMTTWIESRVKQVLGVSQ